MLIIKNTKKYGRGLYSTKNIKKGDIVEISPIVVLDKYEAQKITDTLLNVYVFEWSKEGSALALGKGGLFNHSRTSNISYMNSFRTKEIFFIATKNIKKGTQLFIDYGYDPLYGISVTVENKKNSLKYKKEIYPSPSPEGRDFRLLKEKK